MDSPRDRLNELAVAKPYMDQWKKTEESFDFSKLQKAYDEKLKVWQAKAAAARKAGKPAPVGRPRPPRNLMTGQHRPANLYNGVLNPIIGYGIKGTFGIRGKATPTERMPIVSLSAYDSVMARSLEAGRFFFLLGTIGRLSK